jgi:hypothetical protein
MMDMVMGLASSWCLADTLIIIATITIIITASTAATMTIEAAQAMTKNRTPRSCFLWATRFRVGPNHGCG